MAGPSKGRGAVKFLFWGLLAASSIGYLVYAHTSGKLAAWYYYTASAEGYAVDADNFKDATKEKPAVLAIGKTDTIEGLQAVHVKKGDRLPANANGVIDKKVLEEAKRATVEGQTLEVTVPWEIKEAKGFKFKDTFKHKGVKSYAWAALFNVLMVFAIGLSLGFMAEGFTDLLGIKVEKIRHFEGH